VSRVLPGRSANSARRSRKRSKLGFAVQGRRAGDVRCGSFPERNKEAFLSPLERTADAAATQRLKCREGRSSTAGLLRAVLRRRRRPPPRGRAELDRMIITGAWFDATNLARRPDVPGKTVSPMSGGYSPGSGEAGSALAALTSSGARQPERLRGQPAALCGSSLEPQKILEKSPLPCIL